MLPSSLGLLLAPSRSSRRSQVVALWGGIGALAVATGPSLGAGLITGFGWRAAFYVNLPVGLVAWASVGGSSDRTQVRRTAGSHPDYPGVVLLARRSGALVLAISEGPTLGMDQPRHPGLPSRRLWSSGPGSSPARPATRSRCST